MSVNDVWVGIFCAVVLSLPQIMIRMAKVKTWNVIRKPALVRWQLSCGGMKFLIYLHIDNQPLMCAPKDWKDSEGRNQGYPEVQSFLPCRSCSLLLLSHCTAWPSPSSQGCWLQFGSGEENQLHRLVQLCSVYSYTSCCSVTILHE